MRIEVDLRAQSRWERRRRLYYEWTTLMLGFGVLGLLLQRPLSLGSYLALIAGAVLFSGYLCGMVATRGAEK